MTVLPQLPSPASMPAAAPAGGPALPSLDGTVMLPADPRAATVLDAEQSLVWSFVGDSVTAGSWHTWGGRGYVELVHERLREIGRPRDGVVNTAVSGWQVGDLAVDLETVCLRYRPDVVTIGIGLNDAKTGPDGVAAFATTYRSVVERVRDETGALIVMQTPNGILPTSTPTMVAHLGPYVAAIRALAAELDAVLVDHDRVWAGTEVASSYHWLGHGCHPNAFGHRAMARSYLQTFGLWDVAHSRTCRLAIP